MKILVTGGSGLVGCAIDSQKAICAQHKFTFLTSKDGDLRDLAVCRAIFTKYNPDIVIHLAANVGGLYKNMKMPVEMLNDNLEMNSNIVKCCKEFQVVKAIFCLSTCIFPDKTTYPIDETMLHNGPPHSSNAAYAYAKRMLEVQCAAYNQEYHTNYMCIIPTNIFGPHDNFHLKDSHVIPGLIHKAYLAKQNNKPFTLLGSGSALRQFIYSNDLARIILYLVDYYYGSDPMICSVGEDQEISIDTVAKTIATQFEIDKLYYDDTYADGQYKKTASNKRLLDFFKKNNIDFQFTPIDRAIEETVTWFKDNYENCRK